MVGGFLKSGNFQLGFKILYYFYFSSIVPIEIVEKYVIEVSFGDGAIQMIRNGGLSGQGVFHAIGSQSGFGGGDIEAR